MELLRIDVDRLDKVKRFVAEGGDVNRVFWGPVELAGVHNYGYNGSLLHWACLLPKTKVEVIVFLLDSGADPELRTSRGKAAYDIAMDKHPDWPKNVLTRLRPAILDAATAQAISRSHLPEPPSVADSLSTGSRASLALDEAPLAGSPIQTSMNAKMLDKSPIIRPAVPSASSQLPPPPPPS